MVRAVLSCTLVLLLTGSAAATPSATASQVDEHQTVQSWMDQNWAEFTKPGPRLEGWDKGGVDIQRLVRAAPGGAKRNVLLLVSGDGQRAVGIFDAGALETYVPNSWKIVRRAGNADYAAGQFSLAISAFDGRFFVAGWEKQWRVGSAFCSGGNLGSVLYEDPRLSVDAQVPPALVPGYFDDWYRRIEKETMCVRYDAVAGAPDRYSVSYFLEDGRQLPGFNGLKDTVTIVPAAPVEELLFGVASK